MQALTIVIPISMCYNQCTGMAFGGGNAIAHRAVDAMMGPRTIRHETVASSVPSAAPVLANSNVCDGQSKAFTDVCSLHLNLVSSTFTSSLRYL